MRWVDAREGLISVQFEGSESRSHHPARKLQHVGWTTSMYVMILEVLPVFRHPAYKRGHSVGLWYHSLLNRKIRLSTCGVKMQKVRISLVCMKQETKKRHKNQAEACGPDGGSPLSRATYPRQASTGSLGYRAYRESERDRSHRKKTLPRAFLTVAEKRQSSQRPIVGRISDGAIVGKFRSHIDARCCTCWR